MNQNTEELNIAKIMPAVVSAMPVALTLCDLMGRVLYYNNYATKILDRKPEYIGRDVRELHQVQKSRDRITEILAAYGKDGREEYTWRLSREGREFQVRVAPLVLGGDCLGLIHTVLLLGPAG